MTDKLELEKKIKMLIGQNKAILWINEDGSINVNIVDSVSRDTVDERSGWVPIDSSSFTDVLVVNADPSKIIFVKEVCVTLKGFSADFIVEHFDGVTTKIIRRYLLNDRMPTFTEMLGNGIPLEYNSNSPKITVKAKMNWQNQIGEVFASINGFK